MKGDLTGDRPRSVALIGPGRAGTSVARALLASGWDVTSVAGSTPSSATATQFAAEVGATRAETPGEAARLADVVVIAVPDHAIAEVGSSLAAESGTGPMQAAYFGHLSGAVGSSALSALSDAGKSVFGFHPVLPFASRQVSPSVFESAPVAISGDSEGIELARTMAESIGASAFVVADEDRVLYHAACVLASNALVALEGVAFEVAKAAGISDPAAVLLPLVKATVSNLEEKVPGEALTGPVARGDVMTVESHISELDRISASAAEIYRVLSAEAADLAAGLDESARTKLIAALSRRAQGDAA
ncbi:MAG: hypothetical protein DCC49_06760 [Acidobacteria bacterium]|nr:MAG: hypothetical protein DCC49_06760 [Acidobacteriota bacterium]